MRDVTFTELETFAIIQNFGLISSRALQNMLRSALLKKLKLESQTLISEYLESLSADSLLALKEVNINNAMVSELGLEKLLKAAPNIKAIFLEGYRDLHRVFQKFKSNAFTSLEYLVSYTMSE